MPRLDLLDGPSVEIAQLGQSLLRDAACRAFPAQIGTKSFKLTILASPSGHAPLGRMIELTNTAQWGVMIASPQKLKSKDRGCYHVESERH